LPDPADHQLPQGYSLALNANKPAMSGTPGYCTTLAPLTPPKIAVLLPSNVRKHGLCHVNNNIKYQ
jgi:hypothetical protein